MIAADEPIPNPISIDTVFGHSFVKAFELGLMVRQAADTIAMSPPLVIERNQIDEIIDLCGKAIKATA
jgi:beta-alanine--pyruvate transaminase